MSERDIVFFYRLFTETNAINSGGDSRRKISSFYPLTFICRIPKEVRAWRELARYRAKLVYMKTSEKNRYQDCMTISNIQLASVLTDPFGKTATDIMTHLLSSDVFDEDVCKNLIHKQAKKKTELIIQSVRECEIEADQRFKMTKAKAHMDYIDNMIIQTEIELHVRMKPHEHILQHLMQIPGISKLSAALILSETGTDFSVFESAKHFVSWAGLAPGSDESAGKKKSARVSKAGQFLKPLLVQCALAAIKSKKEPYFASKYQRIKKHRGHKKAIIAISRMLLTCAYHMVSTGEAFKPSDFEELRNPSPMKKQKLTDDLAIEFLRNQGYDVSALKKSS